MYMKRCMTESFWIASALVSIQKLIIVCTWSFRKQTISPKSKRYFLKKSLCHAPENVTNRPSALLFLPPGCLQEWNLSGKFALPSVHRSLC